MLRLMNWDSHFSLMNFNACTIYCCVYSYKYQYFKSVVIMFLILMCTRNVFLFHINLQTVMNSCKDSWPKYMNPPHQNTLIKGH